MQMGFPQSQYNQMVPKQSPLSFQSFSLFLLFFFIITLLVSLDERDDQQAHWYRHISVRQSNLSGGVNGKKKTLSRKLAFPCIVRHRGEKGTKEDEDKCQRNALVRVAMTGGSDLKEGGRNIWNKGEINLAGSGLSEVVIIAGGETMIALMWWCLLWAARACLSARVHALMQTHRSLCM